MSVAGGMGGSPNDSCSIAILLCAYHHSCAPQHQQQCSALFLTHYHPTDHDTTNLLLHLIFIYYGLWLANWNHSTLSNCMVKLEYKRHRALARAQICLNLEGYLL